MPRAEAGTWAAPPDFADWGTSSTHRVQDAYGVPGVRLGWDLIAFENLEVIAFTYVPEPSTGLMLATGLLGLAARRRPRSLLNRAS